MGYLPVNTSVKRNNVYLIGFMGTGKSAVSHGLAERLHYSRMDVDEEIEAQQGCSVADIFAQQGEAHFRALEKAFIEHGHPDTGVVVACGGGLPIQPGLFDMLAARGDVVALLAEPETILERTRQDSHRPLLNTEHRIDVIRDLLAERAEIYHKAHLCVKTDGLSVAAVVDIICQQL